MTDQVEKLKQLAAAAAREAVLPVPEDYRVHRAGKEIRSLLKTKYPAVDFHIASADGFDSMYGEHPPMIELRWNDAPSIAALYEMLHPLIEQRRKDFHFETLTAHGFTCRTCGRTHGGMLEDKPCSCPDCGINPCPW
jgi:hypothetical protein